MKNDLKTSITALVTGGIGLAGYFGYGIPETWVVPIVTVGMMLVGLLSRDGKAVR